MNFLTTIVAFIVTLGCLIVIHELGHYLIARLCNVKVLRFSVGFGRALWSRHGRDGTEYVIAAIPLGGYVKMLDEREGDVPPDRAHRAFNRQGVWARIAIVAAGPVANLLLCVALLWAMFVVGRPDYAPVLGATQGIAADAGLRRGDTLLAIGERHTPTWSEAMLAVTTAAMDHRDVPVRVRTADGDEATRTLGLSRLPGDFDERRAVGLAGLVPRHHLVPAVVGRIEPGLPAEGVLEVGDRITAIDGMPVDSFDEIGPRVQRLGGGAGSGMIEVARDGERLALEITPTLRAPALPADAGARGGDWVLGVGAAPAEMPPPDAELRHGPLAAVPAALRATWRMGRDTFGMIGRMATGSASAQNVSGPITIARVANASAEMGPAWFLQFLALLSLGLAILNLLPIPVLDGGHLLYYLIELAKGSPLSERAMAAGQYVGLVLLAGLMGLAFYNDILLLVR